MVIMIDAGLKLEGEMVGEVSEGIGAAIGGPGVDAFKIEEKLTKYKMPNLRSHSQRRHRRRSFTNA